MNLFMIDIGIVYYFFLNFYSIYCFIFIGYFNKMDSDGEDFWDLVLFRSFVFSFRLLVNVCFYLFLVEFGFIYFMDLKFNFLLF